MDKNDPLAFMNEGPANAAVPAADDASVTGADKPKDTKVEAKPEAKTGEEGQEAAPLATDAAEGMVEISDGKGGKKQVPLATFLELRDENKDLKKRLKELEPEQEEFVAPDPKENPVEYARFQEARTQFQITNERMNFSERIARKEHGNELIDKVRDWAVAKFDEDPAFTDTVVQSVDPYATALEAYNRDQLTAKMTPERLAAFEAWEAAQANGEDPPKPAAAKAVAPATPPVKVKPPIPKSIAGAASASGREGSHSIPVGPGNAFDVAFQGR